MKKEIEIVVPKNWSAVTLRKYLELKKDLELYKDDEEALLASLLYHLCGVEPLIVQLLDIKTISTIQHQLNSFTTNTELPLERFITIDGVEYGLEPDLSQMSYGAYVDLGKYDVVTIDENWAKVMSILYRPVTDKKGVFYSIEKYSGVGDWEKFLDVDMGVNFGTLFFFINLARQLVKNTLNSLKDTETLPHNISITLEKSMEHIHQLSNLHKGILDT
jgi:hypothetical protein